MRVKSGLTVDKVQILQLHLLMEILKRVEANKKVVSIPKLDIKVSAIVGVILSIDVKNIYENIKKEWEK